MHLARKEHPEWTSPEGFTIPAGFVDTSWHNDSCPSFSKQLDDHRRVCLWIDYADPAERETGVAGRYYVCIYGDEHGEALGKLYLGDDIAAAIKAAEGAE